MTSQRISLHILLYNMDASTTHPKAEKEKEETINHFARN